MADVNLPETVSKVFNALSPLEQQDRSRVIKSVMALFGEPQSTVESDVASSHVASSHVAETDLSGDILGAEATRWMRQNHLKREYLDEVFHISGDGVQLITRNVPGNTRKDRTINCYLLEGARCLLETDSPAFDDADAMQFTQHVGAYDKNNHTSNRKSLGNRVSGDRKSGLTLTVPGLREAADLIRQIGGVD